MTSAEIRQQYLDFFKSKQHQIVASAPIVIKNDPTLLFTNAGMNQFKDLFLGNGKPSHNRIADTQKCLRVSGKHNDLEEVGVDTYHHTMFEMLGNWSFGDYFKTEAIAWSWELLTEIFDLEKDKLYVTIFEGDDKEGLLKDMEAFNEWKKVISEDRILLGNKKDNFWEMGDTGPCGPCTEIHFDCRTNEERALVDGKTLVNNDHPQVIEIWNIVFMQFNRLKDGSLQTLPAQHVDTGMGFERLVRVIQGKKSNYDTDVFTSTISVIEQITKKEYHFADTKQDIAFRVLADHIRAIAFTIADGQLPSNTGAGYVIRRILRRAVRYYYSYLDYKQPLLHQLMPTIAKQFEQVFPELFTQLDFVSKVVKEEEDAFLRTVDKGLAMLNDASENISGEAAFKLYDTFGFPLDLTMLVASEKGLSVDEAGFTVEMQKQKTRSRSAAVVDTDDWVIVKEDKKTTFKGYDNDKFEIKTSIVKHRKIKTKGSEALQIVLAETPFYAESGGQVGDTGVLEMGFYQMEVVNTKKENNLIIHVVASMPVNFEDFKGEVTAKIDVKRRKEITSHHSATHLLHAALRQVLGTHVAQKGSLVNEEQLRFDFSHFAKVSDEEIVKIETIVNQRIRENIPVVITEMPKEAALELGAMALFGEKYGDVVRVVVMDKNYSVELCGGTHVGNTGELGFFKIKHETAVAAGVRRIEAVSGFAAEALIQETISTLNSLKSSLKNPKDILKSVETLLSENTDLRKKIESFEAKQLLVIRKELAKTAISINDTSFIGSNVEVNSAESLKKLANDLLSNVPNLVVVLTVTIGDKASVAIAISESVHLNKGLDAQKIIKEIVAPLIKGGGGGQKLLATAGGQDMQQLSVIIEKVKALL